MHEPEHRRSQAPPHPPWPEARFRIAAANASPRTIRVVCLNDADADVALCRARAVHRHVHFSGPAEFRASTGLEPAQALDGAAAQRLAPERLAQWLATPDLVVVTGAEHDDPTLGIVAAQAYRGRPISVAGLIRADGARAAAGPQASDTLRPWCSTMLLVNGTGYLDDLLEALGTRE